MNLKNRVLKLENNDFENIEESMKNGCNPLEALEKELEKNKLKLKNVSDIEVNLGQMKKYSETYAKIVTYIWNKRD